jgi:N-acetylglucosamine-6-phosphate deacetylase
MIVELPGFFDLQVNGFAGVDFNSPALLPEDVCCALDAMRSTGVTRCLPTLITSSFDHFAAGARAVLGSGHPAIAGFHMEGPYISPEDGPRGAHRRADVIAADADDFARRQEACAGQIKLVTLAPEIDGALPLIERLAASGVRVAIGHTAASPARIREAISAGATLATHLGNGCAQMLPRHPNAIWELLAADEVSASLIVDGHHLPPSTVKAMVRAKGVARTILVTDAISAAGCAPGPFQLGEVGSPYLAGSALTMEKAVENAVRYAGLTLQEAAAMASRNPAGYLSMAPSGTVIAEWDAGRMALRVAEVRDGPPAAGILND